MKWAEMSHEQRDALIAEKVLGWKQAMPYEVYQRYLWVREEAPGLTKDTPPFSQSMDAAWLVLQHIYDQYYSSSTWSDYPTVFRRFVEELMGDDRGSFEDEMFPAGPRLLSIARKWTPDLICHAALRAVDPADSEE